MDKYDYKIMFCDLDGTMLLSDHTIGSKTLAAMKDAEAAGKHVTIATGRATATSAGYVKQLAGDVPVIYYNGALVKTAKTDKILYQRPLDYDVAQFIAEYCDKHHLTLQWYTPEKYYTQVVTPFNQLYADRNGILATPVGPLHGYFDEAPVKLLIVDTPERIAEVRRELEPILSSKCLVVTSMADYIEFMSLEAGKDSGIRFVCDYLGIPVSDSIAIGDGENDAAMVRFAGLGIAMENAVPGLRRVAGAVVPCCDDEGVAYAIRRYMLGEEL